MSSSRSAAVRPTRPSVSLPPLLVLGIAISLARPLARCVPIPRGWPRRSRRPGHGRWALASSAGRVPGARGRQPHGGAALQPDLAAGRVGGRARLGQPPVWSLSGLAGTLRFAASESWEPIRDQPGARGVAATLTAALAWALAWTSRRSLRWQILCSGDPGPHAGHARPGRRHGDGARLPLDFPRSTTRPSIVVLAQSMRTPALRPPDSLAGAANPAPSCSSRRPWTAWSVGPGLARGPAPLRRALAGGLVRGLRPRLRRAARDEPAPAAGRDHDHVPDLDPAAHRRRKPPGRRGPRHAGRGGLCRTRGGVGVALGRCARPTLRIEPGSRRGDVAALARASRTASAVVSAAWMQSGMPTPSKAIPVR